MNVAAGPSSLIVLDKENELRVLGGNIPDDSIVKMKWEKISCGLNLILLLKDSKLYCTGKNRYGELGFKEKPINKITKVHYLPPIDKICCSNNFFSLLLDTNGNVWVSGNNRFGQLGLENIDNSTTFTMIHNLPKIKSFAAGSFHSLLLDENGEIWGSGKNSRGQIGFDYVNTREFKKVDFLTKQNVKCKKISSLQCHTLIIDEFNELWVTGDNTEYQLGIENRKGYIHTPVKIDNVPSVMDISAGINHSLILDFDGNVWATGLNTSGQLGVGGSYIHVHKWQKVGILPPIVNIHASAFYSVFIDLEGSIWFSGIALEGVYSTHAPSKITEHQLETNLPSRQKSAKK